MEDGPLPLRDGRSFEPNWDGFRALSAVDRVRVSLVSRQAPTSWTSCSPNGPVQPGGGLNTHGAEVAVISR
jgi:ATP-dependent DNA ligase